ncbi:MAG: hypothetical protein FWB94_05200 [Chitinispirillia bacterium]|nr:hypothetical protein [Chitinispirillia bacterium]
MKRLSAVAVALLIASSSAFASWDYFPPKESGGEAKLGFAYSIPAEKRADMGLYLGARYTIIEGLEASLILPVPLSSSFDGNGAKDYVGLGYDPATDKKFTLGVRYWLPMGLGLFVDAFLPVDTRDGYEPDFDMDAGVQYSMTINDQMKFGAELGLALPIIENEDFDMYIGAEFNYSLGMVTPLIGIGLGNLLSDADMTFDLTVGATFEINEALGADVTVGLGLAGYGDNNMPVTIGASVSYGF